MALNGIQATGDDQQWKAQVERELAEIRSSLATVISQLTNLNGGR